MRRWWPVAILSVATVACAVMAGWGMRDVKTAHDCLNNGSYSADITERGCEIHAGSGHTLLVPLDGPGFGTTVAATIAGLVLLAALSVLVVRRLRPVSASRAAPRRSGRG